MTPLQQAAQAIIDSYKLSAIAPMNAIVDLIKALEAEQAQAVEPVCRNCIGTGWEPHTYRGRIPCSHCHPTPAMHLSEILAEKGIILRTEFEPKPDHIVDSNKMVGERAELIARLQEAQVMMDYDPIEAHAAMGAAIDMLEADTKEIERVTEMAHSEKRFADMHYTENKAIKAQQVAVPVPPCWYIEYKTHGQVTLRKDEADSAIENGAIRVIAYVCDTAQQVAVPDAAIIKEIERAIVDHCTGGDLWMSASLGKDRIKRLMAPQGGKT